jgi:GNAT superfamily N-acetyltransferase
MTTINWEESALASEIAYSKALKSEPTEYPNFIHIHNPFVPWNGDFNRAINVKITDFKSLYTVTSQIKIIHHEKALEQPNRFDIAPPTLDKSLWQDYLTQKGYRLSTAIFFCAPTTKNSLPPEYKLVIPPQDEYLEWFQHLALSRGYYEEAWFQSIKPLQIHFSQVFRPYWLLKEENLIGWVYCANLGRFSRLFEVEVDEKYRGQGVGRLLLQAIRAEGHRLGSPYILLQSGEHLRQFYESAGFRECTRNSIIWRKE